MTMSSEERNTTNVPQNLVTQDSRGPQPTQQGGAANQGAEASLFTGRPAGSGIESRPASLDSVLPSAVG